MGQTVSKRKNDVESLPDVERIPIGVSACAIGHEVRYDGGHKRDLFVMRTLGPYVDYRPVCPEVELGLGTPRPTIRLAVDPENRDGLPLLIMPSTGEDLTKSMESLAEQRVSIVEEQQLCGFIVQKGSPSCGMSRVKVHDDRGGPSLRNGVGVFTRVLMERYPSLPVEEIGRLNDARLRENFITRIFAYSRAQKLFRSDWTMGDLVDFHSREKCLILAHHPVTYKALGRLVAGAKTMDRADVETQYVTTLMKGLAKIANLGRNSNVLQHLLGYFKRCLDAGDRLELVKLIGAYQKGLVPLVVPITLMRHHVRRQRINYLAMQTYLEPHPSDLMLRNHV